MIVWFLVFILIVLYDSLNNSGEFFLSTELFSWASKEMLDLEISIIITFTEIFIINVFLIGSNFNDKIYKKLRILSQSYVFHRNFCSLLVRRNNGTEL